jgi:DNA-binding NarL/FixJ family response regulator
LSRTSTRSGLDRIKMTQLPATGSDEKCQIRVLLADESPVVRQHLRAELKKASWVELVGEVDNSQEAIALFFELKPDAVVLSTCLKGEGGFEVLRCIKRAFADCVAILTSRHPDHFINEAGRLLGAAAVCCVSEHPIRLLTHLRRSTHRS